MKKGIIAIIALTLLLGIGGYTLANEEHHKSKDDDQITKQEQMSKHKGELKGGYGMMGMMDKGMMSMMGHVTGSNEMMGTMMSMHGEMMSHMGKMMQKHGKDMGNITPELQKQMRKEMFEKMGDIMIQHGKALKEKASVSGE